MNWNIIDQIIINALNEDMPYGDITSDHIFDDHDQITGTLICKEDGVISGIDIFERVMKLVDSNINVTSNVKNGDLVQNKSVLATITGPSKSVLKGERVALNLLQRMSGIATMARTFSNEVKDFPTKIVDTRKTTPNLRYIEKIAVRHGGAYNHRFNLSDAVMIKDNHIKACGSITEAVMRVQNKLGHTFKIEVEVESIEQFKEALKNDVDIIMLDNMDNQTMAQCVKLNQRKAILEASGNMDLERLKEVAAIGVDVISVGKLTHSVKSLDISLKF